MRTPTILSSALAAIAGSALMALPGVSSATDIVLSSCSTWSINNGVFSCSEANVTPPPSGAPSSCSVSATQTTLPSTGGTVAINATCSGTAATSWSWTGGFMAGSTSPTGSGSVTATTTFTGTPSNASGSGSPVSVTVTVQSSTNTGGGGGQTPGGIACSGFSNTRVIPLDWGSVVAGANLSAYTTSYGSFGGNDAVVVMFTTPASTSSAIGSFAGAEAGGGAIRRTATLSASACDFGSGLGTVIATAPSLYFSVGPNGVGASVLEPNTTYYVNIKNKYRTTTTCTDSSCDMIVSIKKPGGI